MSNFLRWHQRVKSQVDRLNLFFEYNIENISSNKKTKNFLIKVWIDSSRKDSNSLDFVRCSLVSMKDARGIKCFNKSVRSIYRFKRNIKKIFRNSINRIFKANIRSLKIELSAWTRRRHANIKTSRFEDKMMMFKQFIIVLKTI